jgi:hypothetical protein
MSRARASRTSCAPRRRSAAGSCARVPEDQSARLPITGPRYRAERPIRRSGERSEKSRYPARGLPPPPLLSRRHPCRPRDERDVLGPTRPASPKQPRARRQRGPALKKARWAAWHAPASSSRATLASAPLVRSQRARPRAGTSAAARSCSACSAREGPRACAPEPWRAASGLAAGVPASEQLGTPGGRPVLRAARSQGRRLALPANVEVPAQLLKPRVASGRPRRRGA